MVGGVIYLPRMLDKIRLDARGVLAEGYHNNLGRYFDGHCLTFLHVEYRDLRERVLAARIIPELIGTDSWSAAFPRPRDEAEGSPPPDHSHDRIAKRKSQAFLCGQFLVFIHPPKHLVDLRVRTLGH